MRKSFYAALALAVGIALMACNRKAANELSSDMLKTYDDLVTSTEHMVTESQQMAQEHESLITQAQDSLQEVDSRYDSMTLARVIEREQNLAKLHEQMTQDYKTLEQYYKDVKNQHTSGAMDMSRIQEERNQLEREHQRIEWEFEKMQTEHNQADEASTGYLNGEKSFWHRPPAPDTMMMGDSLRMMRDSMRMDSMRGYNQNPTMPRDTTKH